MPFKSRWQAPSPPPPGARQAHSLENTPGSLDSGMFAETLFSLLQSSLLGLVSPSQGISRTRLGLAGLGFPCQPELIFCPWSQQYDPPDAKYRDLQRQGQDDPPSPCNASLGSPLGCSIHQGHEQEEPEKLLSEAQGFWSALF